MSEMQVITEALENNNNLPVDIKNKFYSLISELKKKIKEVDLKKLSVKLATLRIAKISKYERREIYYYDVFQNTIFIDVERVKGNYDIDLILTKALLEIATCTRTYTGFNSDERLRALNLAYTEILATYVVGNEGDSDLEEEVFIANLLSHIVGSDTMFNSYFTNNGEPIIKAMLDVEVGL